MYITYIYIYTHVYIYICRHKSQETVVMMGNRQRNKHFFGGFRCARFFHMGPPRGRQVFKVLKLVRAIKFLRLSRQVLAACGETQKLVAPRCWLAIKHNYGKTMGKWWLNGGLMGFYGMYPLMTNITMENHHVQWENPLFMAMFNSYVSHYPRKFIWPQI